MGEAKITGLILAGGLSRRMGERDKGLIEFHGEPMIAHVMRRLSPQIDELLINANANLERYAQVGPRVIADAVAGYAGPLAGIEAGLTHARHDLLVAVPCDAPRLPTDLVARLHSALQSANADVVAAQIGTQPHPVFCLMRRSVHAHLRAFLDAGGRKVDAWLAALQAVYVDFSDAADAFANINTPDELQHWETR